MTYSPKPIDTSGIELSAEVLRLCERLAENAHDIWAQKRIEEGWTLGEQRDDELKISPCLVPYNELPESEKEYDRQLALSTLKAIIALGHRIE